jgi:hypothetical protein
MAMQLFEALKEQLRSIGDRKPYDFIAAGVIFNYIAAESGGAALAEAAEFAGTTSRKAYYTITTAKIFSDYPDRPRLLKIGWTKIEKIATHVETQRSRGLPVDLESLVKSAETLSAVNLDARLKGRKAVSAVFNLNFTDSQWTTVCEALIAIGRRHPDGAWLGDKETGFVELARLAMRDFKERERRAGQA